MDGNKELGIGGSSNLKEETNVDSDKCSNIDEMSPKCNEMKNSTKLFESSEDQINHSDTKIIMDKDGSNSNNVPVQVQQVDSSEKSNSTTKSEHSEVSIPHQILIKFRDDSEFLIPSDVVDCILKTETEDELESLDIPIPSSFPKSFLKLLPEVLGKALSFISKKVLGLLNKEHSSNNRSELIESINDESFLSESITLDSDYVCDNDTSSSVCFLSSYPISKDYISKNGVETVGNSNERSSETICTYLINLKNDKVVEKATLVKVNNSPPNLSDKNEDEDDDADLKTLGIDVPKSLKIKRKRKGKKKLNSSESDQNKPISDRLICDICPNPSAGGSNTQELNCNDVGPNYGIRITPNVSRCFICNVELKSSREVWSHAESMNHKQQVHNLLVNQNKQKKSIPVRQTLFKGQGSDNDSHKSSSPIQRPESDEVAATLSNNLPIESKDDLEMPKLKEEKFHQTRKRSTVYTFRSSNVSKRSRKSSVSSSDSLPVLEKIMCRINTCPICETEFDDVVQKLDHAMRQHEEYKAVLSILASVVHSAREDEELRACMVCKKVYNGVENLLSHLIAAHQIKPRMLENVESAKHIISDLLERKQKPNKNSPVASSVEEDKKEVVIKQENTENQCMYCKRKYTTKDRLQNHFKLTGHQKLSKKGRLSKQCPHCHKNFKTVVASKVHMKKTSPDPNGGPCKIRFTRSVKEEKKPIVRVPGGGIKDAIPSASNLTCLNCNEAFSTVHTYQLHTRTTSPTKSGCVPLTPSFKVGGGKPIFRNLIKGEKAHISPKLQCEICSKSFISELELSDHCCKTEQTKDGKNLSPNVNKNKAVSESKEEQSSSNVNIKKTLDEEKNQCKFCLKTFKNPFALKMHNRITIPDEDLKICVRPHYKKKSIGVIRLGMKKKRKPRKILDEYLNVETQELDKNLNIPHNDSELLMDSLCYSSTSDVSFKLANVKNERHSASFDESIDSSCLERNVDSIKLGIKSGNAVSESKDTCAICDRKFSTTWNRNAHERNMHQFDRKLNLSLEGSPSNLEFVSNEKSASSDGVPLKIHEGLICQTCNVKFETEDLLNEHYELTNHFDYSTHFENENSYCKFCDTCFLSKFSKLLHCKYTIPIAKLGKCFPVNELNPSHFGSYFSTLCQICGQDMVSVVARLKHENITHRSQLSKKYGKSAKTANVQPVDFVIANDQTTSNIQMKSCKICKKEFISASQLQMHYATAHHGKQALLGRQIIPNIKKPSQVGSNEIKHNVVDNSNNNLLLRTCRFCQKVFTKVWNRKFHEVTVHNAVKKLSNKKLGDPQISISPVLGKLSDSITIEPVAPALSELSVIPLKKPIANVNNSKAPLFSCIQCKRVYTSQDRLDNHYKITSHNQKSACIPEQTCQHCNKTFKSVRALKIHAKVTVPDPNKGICNYRVGLELSETENLKGYYDDPLSKSCSYCPRQFSTPWHRRVHEVRTHIKKELNALKSENSQSTSTPKVDHSPVTKPLDVSKIDTKSKYYYRNDEGDVKAVDDKMLKRLCRVCKKIFTTIWYLRAHVRKHHPDQFDQHYHQIFPEDKSDEIILCSLATVRNNNLNNCSLGKGIASVSPIKSVESQSHEEKLLKHAVSNSLGKSTSSSNSSSRKKCKICNRIFKWHSALEVHERSCNPDVLNYKCRFCGVMFRERRQLGPHWRKHRRNNEGITPSISMFVSLDKPNVPLQAQPSSRSSVFHTARMQSFDTHSKFSQPSVNQPETSNVNNNSNKHLECYRCAGCNKIFMNAVKFIQHRLTHFSESSVTEISEKKPFCCEVCNMVLEHHTLVQVHLLEHLRLERRKSCYVHNQVLKPGMLIKSASPPPEDSENNPDLLGLSESQISNVPNKQPILNVPLRSQRRPQCSFCGKRFINMARYLNHKKLNQCSAQQQLKDKIWQQMKLVQETGKFTQTEEGVQLDEEFLNLDGDSSLTEKIDDEIPPIELNELCCRFCWKTFDNLTSRENHELLQCEATTYCRFCTNQFDSSLSGITHVDFHHPSSNIRCTPCHITFDNFDEMKSHVDSLLENHPGSICEFSSKSASSINSDVKLILDSDSEDNLSTTIEIINHPELDGDLKTKDSNNPVESESSKPSIEVELKTNFSKLLKILLNDDNVLQEIGWKDRPIEKVLIDLIIRTGLTPSNPSSNSLDSLRENIKLLLTASLEGDVLNSVGFGKDPIDDVVGKMLNLSESV